MEHFIDENTVMRFYLAEMEADRIEFLKGKEDAKKEIADRLNALLAAEKMNDKIQIASGLWKILFETSMSYIDKDKKGYDKLFSYFDEYVEFEELIFASDSFYRDHTLHCMWVYLLGEYIYRCGEFDILLEKDKEEFRIVKATDEALVIMGIEEKKELGKLHKLCGEMEKVVNMRDSIRCVAALTHDLGYPIKKIDKINKSIRKVLPYYSMDNFEDFNFGYGNVNQKFIDVFLRILATNLNHTINTGNYEEQDLVLQLLRTDDETHMRIEGVNEEFARNATEEQKQKLVDEVKIACTQEYNYGRALAYSNDFESYQHGIMSAFLLVKNLSAFQKMDQVEGQTVDLRQVDYAPLFAKQTILSNISDHTRENFQIRGIDINNYLTFIDELEEFSRISRASQNREYVEEFCSSRIYMDGDGWFCVDFTFDNDELDNLDPKKAFKGRCKRFLNLFEIARLDENLKIRLRCIGKLKKDQSVYQLELARKHAVITVDGEPQNIPQYLNSPQFYTSEEYAAM